MWDTSASPVVMKIMRLDGITHRENMEHEGLCEQYSGEHHTEGRGIETGAQTRQKRFSCRNRKETKTYQSWKSSPKEMQRSAASEDRQSSPKAWLKGKDLALELWSLQFTSPV